MIDNCAQYSLAVRYQTLQKTIPKLQWGISTGMLPYDSSPERHPWMSGRYQSPVRIIKFNIPIESIINLFK